MPQIEAQAPTPLSVKPWRGPTIVEIAAASGVGTATVDRVLNGRDNVRDETRTKVLAALDRLRKGPVIEIVERSHLPRVGVVSCSGASYNATLAEAIEAFHADDPSASIAFEPVLTSRADPVKLANMIERLGATCDGLVVVAREDLNISRAVRNVSARGVPVVCLTTDLTGSGRLAYVGCDQTAAGATAAWLMGQSLKRERGHILLVHSAPFRCQGEREFGFRQTLRQEFPDLAIDGRVPSNDDPAYAYDAVSRAIEERGVPLGIYNVSAGNVGVARALDDHDIAGQTIFIGHELNPNSRALLTAGSMHYAIGHDVREEFATAVGCLVAAIEGEPPKTPPATSVRVFTRYSCS